MRIGLAASLFSLFLFLAGSYCSAAEALLAEGGQAKMQIVLSAKASDATKAVAQELKDYLSCITGAQFQITTGDGSSGIVLGTLEQFPDPAMTKPLEIRGRFDGLEAFCIRTEPTRVRLIGAAELGTSHAAFAFLESVGCRWIFPAKEWEVVPSIATLKVSTNLEDRPVIPSRREWYGYGTFYDAKYPRRAQDDYAAWARHNRMASSLPIRAGHAWQSVIAANKKTFEEHPEYLALTGGKRQGEQLCVSNPTVRQLVVDYVLKQFEPKKTPKGEVIEPPLMASVECSDGGGHCECEGCRAIGTPSDQAFDLANHVAREVQKKYPGRFVGLLAYNQHCEPPKFDLEPNVYVQLTAGFISGRYTFDELADLWPKKCKNIGFYEYFSVWLWDFDRLPGGRGGDIHYVQKAIRRYADRHATSLDCESGNNWGPHGRGYLLANRLMWNPYAEPGPILADFYEKAFGPGAAAMKRYYDRLDSGRLKDDNPALPQTIKAEPVNSNAAPGLAMPESESVFSRHLVAMALRDLEEATKLTQDRPDIQARLDQLKGYLRYIRLCWQRDREPDKEKKKAIVLQILTHVYRTRFTYMNHFAAIRSDYIPKVAKDFGEPAWDPKDRTQPKAWMDERPVTPAETAQWFKEMLEYFQPQKVEERTFSWDLVPGNLEGPTVATAHHYQKPVRYALYSKQGEPLDVEVTTGTIAWYRNRPEARYALSDPAGKVIEEGRVPQDGRAHPLSLKVPGAGLYIFECFDQSAGWKMQVAAGKSASIILRRGTPYSHLGWMSRTYFFVPKGTRTLHYFWTGRPHEVLGPDGKVIAKVEKTGEFVSIPVPEGADGKPWSFAKFGLGHLWFFNAPNVVAASPGALVLPKELVEAKQTQ